MRIYNKNSHQQLKLLLLPLNTKTLSTLPLSIRAKSKTYSPFLLHIAKGNHQGSKGRGGGKSLLFSAKSALKATTSVSSSSMSYP